MRPVRRVQLEERWDSVQQDLALSDVQLHGLLRCTLVHELVHALQHQYGVSPAAFEGDRRRGMSALWEGHATHVESQWCQEEEGVAIQRLERALSQTDIPQTLGPGATATLHAWGAALVAELEAEDPELVWTALAGHPPSWSTWADGRPPPWSPSQPLVDGLVDLGWSPDSLRVDATSPALLLLNVLQMESDLDELPDGRAGVGVVAVDDHGFGLAGAMVLDGPAGPWIERLARDRRRDTRARWHQRPPRGLRRTHGVDRALLLVGHRPAVTQAWIARGPLLLIVALSGPPPATLQETLGTMLDGMPRLPEPPPGIPDTLTPWRMQLRGARDTVAPVVGWGYRAHRAQLAAKAGSACACTHQFDAVLQPGAVPDPGPFARAALRCAVGRHEPALVDRALTLADAIDPDVAAHHGRALVRARRWSEVVELMDRTLPTADPHLGRRLADLELEASVMSGWASRGLPLSQTDTPSPHLRAWAAEVLMEWGLESAGRNVLRDVCPLLSGDAAAPCRTLDGSN